MDAIQLIELGKCYGAIPAVSGVSLRVPTGSIFGFLGPNGAGKTTVMRILVGLLRSTKGTARVLGMDVWRDSTAIREHVGYLPGDVRLYEWMRGRRLLDFFNRARGGRCDAEIARLTQRFDLDVDRPIRDYSRGMKQKLGLIAALMHRPRLLILDEPTTALDPLVQQTLYDELRSAAGEGRTVLFSSHTLSEVESLCDRVAIIRTGRIIEDSTIEALRQRAVRRVVLRIPTGEMQKRPIPAAWIDIESRDGTAVGAWKGEARELVSWLADLPIQDVVIGAPDLEDLFAAYYQGDERC